MGLRRLQRLQDGGTNARGWADLTRADHEGDADMRSRESGRIWRGQGMALADAWAGEPARMGRGFGRRAAGRFRHGQKGSAAGRR